MKKTIDLKDFIAKMRKLEANILSEKGGEPDGENRKISVQV
ncbi:hypothetical protein V6B14_03550 [Sporosarcina psychrophila]